MKNYNSWLNIVVSHVFGSHLILNITKKPEIVSGQVYRCGTIIALEDNNRNGQFYFSGRDFGDCKTLRKRKFELEMLVCLAGR
jgi:hypothetical protein